MLFSKAYGQQQSISSYIVEGSKLYMNFLLHGGSAPPAPVFFKGQLYAAEDVTW